MKLDARHDAILGAVEDLEFLSLRWGDVDASISLEDVEALACSHVGNADEAGQVLDDLIESRLLHAIRSASGDRFRSRFAEMVRLLARSRQTYLGESWKGSPPLVADFRVDMRPRRYPRRVVPRDEAVMRLEDADDLEKRIWRALAPDRLAGFQVRAAQRLRNPPDADRALIVTAGTGSGKTLAFYLPVFVALGAAVRPDAFWTKAIAIYPRNELLKDQLTEAYRNAGRLHEVLQEPSRRNLRIGTFYGDTPGQPVAERLPRSWIEKPKGWICPFLRCDCGGDMVWTRADIAARVERLVCHSCGKPTDERLVLTRASALHRPPDILFTSAEMLNQSLCDQKRRALFGIGVPRDRSPSFILLDEAHTYAGTSGAQAALTLRRWRSLTAGPLSWVGLSATLEDAPRFFANLTGVGAERVIEVRPEEDEMVEEGREYQLALRGDPGSRASLLSTTIQTAMLVGRTLDPEGGRSDGRFGRRIFAFTDDLDVTHRLFHDLRDAEGYDRFGKPDPRREPLATMRGRILPAIAESDQDRRLRDAAGQRWSMQEDIGRPLGTRLRIGKTTSGDPGVDAGADLIVATSALEVGFNDPNVGAVLQHKAPRDYASFLQRRGRAGRDRRMRPITITILSDYGRDRAAFQGFEHLFDPRLEPQHLPIANQYILRMQAAFALLDWIAGQPRPRGVGRGSVWTAASGPADPRFADPAYIEHVKRTVGRIVKGEEIAVASLSRHLRNALAIDSSVVERLLWEPPRSILLEVAPTLARRLLRDWRLAWPTPHQTHDAFAFHRPLPEAAPRTLFSDLNLPEVEIVVPPDFRSGKETRESMSAQQALSQLAPGRVTRRFGEAYGGLAHWSPLPSDPEDVIILRVAQYAERSEYLGRFAGTSSAGREERCVYRPWAIRLQKAGAGEVKPSSNSAMRWASAFVPNGAPIEVAPPAGTAWRGLVARVEMNLQAYGGSVSVRRFACGARAELKRPDGSEQLVDVEFADETRSPAAMGYEFETDGLLLSLKLPSGDELASRRLDLPLERGVRAALLRNTIAFDREFPRDLNLFQRAWLRQINLLAAAARALDRGGSLANAAASLAREGGMAHLETIMDSLLGIHRADAVAPADEDADEDEDDEEPNRNGPIGKNRLERLRAALRERLLDKGIRARLDTLLVDAQDPKGAARPSFLRTTLESTLAEATLAAAAGLAPRRAATDTLIVDLVPSERNGEDVGVWVTETTVGGAGALAAIAESVAGDPRTLFRAMESALEPSDLEQAAASLVRCFRLAAYDEVVAAALQDVRREPGHTPRALARERLIRLLEARGVQTGRAFNVSLAARMLAAGLAREHDLLVNALLDFWDRIEAWLTFEFDPRDVSVLALGDATVMEAASRTGLFTNMMPDSEKAATLAGLLWPRSGVMGRNALTSYNPFRTNAGSDPLLVRALLLETDAAAVALENEGWMEAVALQLAEDGVAKVDAPAERGDLIRTAIIRLPATPVTIEHLKLYPSLERIARDEGRISATFVLKERV